MDVRYGMLVLPAQPMGTHVGGFIFSHSKGLETFDLVYQTEGEFKRFIKEVNTHQGPNLFEVPPGHARFVLAEAVSRTLDLSRPLPKDYESFVPLIGAVPLPEQPLIYELIDADHVREKIDSAAMSARLLNHELLATWPLTSELAPYLHKLDEIEDSVLVLADHQKAERKEGVYEQAEREIFVPEKRTALKRCLEETALLFWQRDEKDLAEGALALALDLRMDNQTVLARRSDFASNLLRYSFDSIVSNSLESKAEQEPFQRSDSGLIIPAGLSQSDEGV
ncbi:MAG: hypothetical protein JRI34_10665, partial [Deltaproteobacteria bacterium]|nr:hypothetical protein [Deltaproteobacteria bacterium]